MQAGATGIVPARGSTSCNSLPTRPACACTSRAPGRPLAARGRVAHGRYDGVHADDTGRTGVDGEVVTGTLGADAKWDGVLAGVAVSLSEGEGGFASPGVDVGARGGIESTLTTVSPYLRFKLTERVSAWGLAGWGTGDMTIRFDDGSIAPVRTDIAMQLGAIGARGALLEQADTGGMDIALKTDAFFVRMEPDEAPSSAETTADASRVRLVLEGGRRFALSQAAMFRPALELGLRHDGGDAETGAGVELGGGVAWADTASGLSLDAKARMLVAHADSDYLRSGRGERHGASRPRGARAGSLAQPRAHHRVRVERHRASVGRAAPARACTAHGRVRGGARLAGRGRLRAAALRRAVHWHAERGARARRRRGARLARRLAADLGAGERPRLRGQSRRDAQRVGQRRRARGDVARRDALVSGGSRTGRWRLR